MKNLCKRVVYVLFFTLHECLVLVPCNVEINIGAKVNKCENKTCFERICNMI